MMDCMLSEFAEIVKNSEKICLKINSSKKQVLLIIPNA